MWIPSWPWNSGPALYPLRVVGGAWEFAHPVYMCFVDLEKSYDRVPRGILWGVLREYGVPGPLVCAIRSLYEQSASCVRILSGCWTPPRLSLVTILFVIFMDRISRRSRGEESVRFGDIRIVSLLFSDDVVLSIYRSIYVPTLTYGHKLWVVTERMRSPIQAAKMCFLRRVAGLSLRDRVRSSNIRTELRIEPLLLRVERSQLRWHLIRMLPGRLPLEFFWARPTGRRPRSRPRTRWRDYISCLAWERLGIPQEELESVAGEKEAWGALLNRLPPRPGLG